MNKQQFAKIAKMAKDVQEMLAIAKLNNQITGRLVAAYGVLIKKGIISEEEINQYLLDSGKKSLEGLCVQPEGTGADAGNSRDAGA